MTTPLYPGHGEFEPWSKKDMRELWESRVVPSLGQASAAEFTGPIEWVGEGRQAIVLGRILRGRPVVVKVIYDDYDHLVGAWMGDRVHPGVAQVISVGKWVDDPHNIFAGHGVVVQERVCMFTDVMAGICPAFTRPQADRLYDVVEYILDPDDPDSTGADDPFADDLLDGIQAIEEKVRHEDGVPLLDDLHIGNVGLVMRDGDPHAVLIDLGMIGSGTPSGFR